MANTHRHSPYPKTQRFADGATVMQTTDVLENIHTHEWMYMPRTETEKSHKQEGIDQKRTAIVEKLRWPEMR